MALRSPISRFVIVALPCYLLLFIIPIPRLTEQYARVYRAAAGWFFREIGKDGFVRFCSAEDLECVPQDAREKVEKMRRATEDLDSMVVLCSRQVQGHYGNLRTSSRLVSYYPTAFSIVLAVAIPIAYRRRLVLGLISLVLVQAFVALRIYVWLVAELSANPMSANPKAYAQFHPSKFWYARLDELADTIHFNPTVTFIAVVVIWAVVLAVSGELKSLMGALVNSYAPGPADAPSADNHDKAAK